jgi:DHA1 family bicyclomycin/chloramphenicol resistance-like MFS transporter
VLVPLVMHSTVGLALASMGLMSVGLVSWAWVRGHREAGVQAPN